MGSKKDDGEFVHLHVHTEYSLLDGAVRLDELFTRLKEHGQKAVAITDHGVMYGIIPFYRKAQEAGIKPIIGCEVYVAPKSRFDKEGGPEDRLHHLVLLAENNDGYRNLMELVTRGFTEGFYYKPRVDRELLAEYSGGLIALSACLAGEIPALITEEQTDAAERTVLFYREIFGEGNFYLELQDHGIPEQKKVNKFLVKLSEKHGIPLVVTNDVHYLDRTDADLHDVLLCIQTGKELADEERMSFRGDQFYLKSSTEMFEQFRDYPQAVTNTAEIASRCEVDIEFGTIHMPAYEVPEGYDRSGYLEYLCRRGLEKRYDEVTDEIEERLEYELEIIDEMGYAGYFLIVWDFISYARKQGIIVGPGRGSSAGSIVAYLLRITDIDPIRYGLLFERFLNPERVSMPDIDIDFCYERRDEVIEYVTEKYGQEHVAQIITFGTMAARAAVRDVGRVMNIPYGRVDRIAKRIPFGEGIGEALEESESLKEAYEGDDELRQLLDMARRIEGMPRHASTHAAGVVISRDPLTNHTPLQRTGDGEVTTQYAMGPLEELGLLKMDFLGLRTLTVLDHAKRIIQSTRNENLVLSEIPLDNLEAYRLLSQGLSGGVFQLESDLFRGLLKEMEPTDFEDLIALLALGRPGPAQVEDYIRRKRGELEVEYPHPRLEPVLKETYGVMLYQEQVMRAASELAGFSLGQADILRRAMGKKKPELLARQREAFIEGALKQGIDRRDAEEIFELMERFGGYGFNKSHSAAYALISYYTAYIKAHYPREYMAALLTSIMGDSDKVADYIEECRAMDIPLLPPDINQSLTNFTVVEDSIRFGLAAVKNVGHRAIRAIISAREEGGPFSSLFDFCERVDLSVVNKKVVESLIKCGAFDSLEGSRAQLLAVLEDAFSSAQNLQKDRDRGQISLLDLEGGQDEFRPEGTELPDLAPFDEAQRLKMEKELLGLYISGHPLAPYSKVIDQLATVSLNHLDQCTDGQEVIVVGIVAGQNRITTKRGQPMSFVILEDFGGEVEVVVFPDLYAARQELLVEEEVLIIQGKVDHQDEGTKIIAERLLPFRNEILELKLDPGFEENGKKPAVNLLYRVRSLLSQNPGDIPVVLNISTGKERVRILIDPDYWAEGQTNLSEVRDKLGLEFD